MHVPPFARHLLVGAAAAALLAACSAPDELGPEAGSILEYETTPVELGLSAQSANLPDWGGAVHVTTHGVGLGNRFGPLSDSVKEATIAVPNGASATQLYVSIALKTGDGYLPPDDVIVTAGGTTLSLGSGLSASDPLDPNDDSALGNVGTIVEGIIPHGADEVHIRIEGTGATNRKTPRGAVVHAFFPAEPDAASVGFAPNYYVYGQQGYIVAERDVALPADFAGGTVTGTFSVADLEDDSATDDNLDRYVTLQLQAGSAVATQEVHLPNLGDEMLVYDLDLSGLPAGATNVTARVISDPAPSGVSPRYAGDSVYWLALDLDYDRTTNGGGQGCTPGFWKNWTGLKRQPDAWAATGYSHGMLFDDVFEDAFPGMTLLEVLNQGGGGLRALGRHTVAALLNAAHPNVSYDVADVIAEFDAVFPGGDYDALKDRFEGFNEQGCPLGRNNY